MKTLRHTPTLVALLAATVPFAANAANIDFTGFISAETCVPTVTSNGVAGPVKLEPVSLSALVSGANAYPVTTFEINLANCANPSVGAYFNADGNVDLPNNGTVKNTGTATGVTIQLVDKNQVGNDRVIDISKGTTQVAGTTAVPLKALTSGNGTLNYAARYYKTGAPLTGGTVAGVVAYTIVY